MISLLKMCSSLLLSPQPVIRSSEKLTISRCKTLFLPPPPPTYHFSSNTGPLTDPSGPLLKQGKPPGFRAKHRLEPPPHPHPHTHTSWDLAFKKKRRKKNIMSAPPRKLLERCRFVNFQNITYVVLFQLVQTTHIIFFRMKWLFRCHVVPFKITRLLP